MLLLAALAAAALQGAPPASAEDPAAGAAVGFFTCAESLGASASKAAFVKQSGDVGRAVAADPMMGGKGFSIDDAEGRGCRVTYAGDPIKAAQLADAFPKLAKDCPQQTVDARGVTCPVGDGTPPFRIEVRRFTGPHGEAAVSGALIDLRP